MKNFSYLFLKKWQSVLVVGCFLFFGITTFIGLKIHHTVLPVADTAGIVSVLDTERFPISRFEYILQEHNEHRIFLTKIILLSDYYFWGGLKIIPQVILHLLNFACFFLLIRFFRPSISHGRGLWVSVLVALFFSLLQLRNFDSVFQLQFFFVNLLAVVSFYFITKYQHLSSQETNSRPLWYLFLSIGAATLAGFNMGNGLLVSVVLCVGMVFVSRNWKHILLCLVATILTWIVYFNDYDAKGGSSIELFQFDFYWKCILYVVYFVGNLFQMRFPGKIDVLAFAIVGSSVGALLTLSTLLIKKYRTRERVFAALLMLFVVLSAAAAASGRIDSGFKQALTTRYCTTTILYWAAFVSICYTLSVARWQRVFVYILSICILASTVTRQFQVMNYSSVVGEKRKLAEMSIKAGMTDMRLISWALPFYDANIVDILSDRGLSIFNSKFWDRGAIQFELDRISDSERDFELSGIKAFDGNKPGENGIVLFGGIKSEIRAKREFYLVNSSGLVKGVGCRLKHSKHFPERFKREGFNDRWICYFNGSLGELTDIQVVSESNFGRSKKHLLSTVDFQGIEVAHFTDLGKRVISTVDVDFKKTPVTSWFKEGFYPHLPIEAPKVKIWGTWHETFGDSKLGALEIELDDHPGQFEQFVLPLLFGPDSSTVTIRIEYDHSDTPIFFDLKDKPSHVWFYLDLSRFISDEGGFKLIIEDGGTGFGQWVAVGTPLSSF